MKKRQNMPKPKLNKAQEKRFDEKFSGLIPDNDNVNENDFKQHLADELARKDVVINDLEERLDLAVKSIK